MCILGLHRPHSFILNFHLQSFIKVLKEVRDKQQDTYRWNRINSQSLGWHWRVTLLDYFAKQQGGGHPSCGHAFRLSLWNFFLVTFIKCPSPLLQDFERAAQAELGILCTSAKSLPDDVLSPLSPRILRCSRGIFCCCLTTHRFHFEFHLLIYL